jgi:SAM-dependent methyltransferase
MVRRFFNANRRLSKWLEQRLPQAREDLFEMYEATVARHMNERPGQLVVDVGGGKTCPFAKYRVPGNRTRIIAVDVSREEIEVNTDVDEARVANVMKELPFAASEVDMIVSRSVLEHLTSLDDFVLAAHRALKPGGYFIHLFPSRNAPFALLNRALPNSVARRIMYFFHPAAVGIGGFPAFYDHCSAAAVTRLLRGRGFEVEECRVSYYQSRYYNFFVPAYLVSAAYELVLRALRQRQFAAYVLVVARKTNGAPPGGRAAI